MIKGRGWASETAREEYASKFFFYFVKPVNSIVLNEPCPPNILFKDLLYWDQQGEVMRRYYTIPETEVRLRNYIASYEEIYDRYPPNLCIIKPFKILLKRSKRFLEQLRSEQEEKQLKKTRRRGFDQLLPALMKTPVYLTSQDFSSSFQHSLQAKQPDLSEQSVAPADKLDFDSNLHDIYDPDYSSDQSRLNEPQTLPEKNSGSKLAKSKSNANLIGGYYVSGKAPAAPDKADREEKLSDLFQKYKAKAQVEPTLTKHSQENFEAAIKLNQHYPDRKADLGSKKDSAKPKKESTNATETEQTREKILGIHSKLRQAELEDFHAYPGYATSRSANTNNQYKSKPAAHKENVQPFLRSRLSPAVTKTPVIKIEDNLSTKRLANQKTKKKKELPEQFVVQTSKPSSSALKKSAGMPETRQRLVEKLNTDRSVKQKSVSKEYSRSNTNYDLFKSIKGTENTLKKKIKTIVLNQRLQSDSKSKKAGLSLEQAHLGASSAENRNQPAFFLKSKHHYSNDVKAKKSQELRGSGSKAGKSSSKNRDQQNKVLMSFQGRSLANISSNLSTEKNMQQFVYAKKHSNKEFSKGAQNLFSHPHQVHDSKTAREPLTHREASKETKPKNKRLDSLVKRLIENSTPLQNPKSSRVCHAEDYPYFPGSDSYKMFFKGLFTPLTKNK